MTRAMLEEVERRAARGAWLAAVGGAIVGALLGHALVVLAHVAL